MFEENEIRVIREAVSRVLNLSFEKEKLRIGEGPGLTVEETENGVRILAESRSALAILRILPGLLPQRGDEG